MSLQQRVQQDLIQVMKNKDTLAKGVLQLLKAGLNATEKEAGHPLTDAELTPVIRKEIKQVEQSLDGARKAGRDELILNEHLKLDILKAYLPAQLSADAIRIALLGAGVTRGMNMGDAMKIAKAKLPNGAAEPRVVSTIVKELIQP